jgi:hypothetical protein
MFEPEDETPGYLRHPCLIGLGCMSGVTLLGCLGCFVLFIRWDVGVTNDRLKARETADQFFELLRQNRIDDAHRACRSTWRAEDFRNFVGRHPAFTAHTSRGVRVGPSFWDPGRSHATVLVTLHSPEGAPDVEVRVEVAETDQGWKVREIKLE